jgi:dethiobiotin synthetase
MNHLQSYTPEAPAVALGEDRAPIVIVEESSRTNQPQSHALEPPARAALQPQVVAWTEDRASMIKAPPCLVLNHGANLDPKLSWACRDLQRHGVYSLDKATDTPPRPGDVAAVRVEEVGNHERLTFANNKNMRIYAGDILLGVFGNRYATAAFEGEVCGVERLSILTAGGMIGTVKSQHRNANKPTLVSFLGFLTGSLGQRVNLIDLKFRPTTTLRRPKNLIVVVGTGMNSGKTTSSVKLIKGLSSAGLRVAACKLTGSVSHRDQDEMASASAAFVTDFSDYGFPSTYLISREDLLALFCTMTSAAQKINPDAIVMEIADGLLQRETAMLLEEDSFRSMVAGLVLSAESAPGAMYAAEALQKQGYKIIAISGVITSAPLAVREFQQLSTIPVGSSADSGKGLTEIVQHFLQTTINDFKPDAAPVITRAA